MAFDVRSAVGGLSPFESAPSLPLGRLTGEELIELLVHLERARAAWRYSDPDRWLKDRQISAELSWLAGECAGALCRRAAL